jgi:hypothetical protein
MENIKIVEVENQFGAETHIIIDRGNNEFTSMPKSVWDELQANQNNGGLN